ncbi:MAG: hypothetical protein AUJ70_02520 [Candidatus Omnitrophica bacterium CG1_02_40_15]|nr:MAG: hypothetical protein AUJ70_02520 [Candidatus Omnitrophica bacterium CG1_02_40_15]
MIGEEAIIIPLDKPLKAREELYVLNETAARVWRLIDGNRSIVDIAKKISSEYDITFKEALIQLRSLLRDLRRMEFIDFQKGEIGKNNIHRGYIKLNYKQKRRRYEQEKEMG